MKPKIEDEIVDTILACPYCGAELPESYSACCGAAGHAANFYILNTGEIIPKLPIGSQNTQLGLRPA